MNRQREATVEKTSRLVPLLLDWFSKNARDLPWRKTSDPYAIWVSEIMLQQTQVKTVIPFWERWMRELPTVESLAKAKPERVLKLWEGLGYYTRARNLQNAAKMVCEKHSGKFPENFHEILALPGIGRYTAGAICSIAFNQPKPILDGNVIRVLTRVFGISENPRDKKTNEQLWNLAEDLITTAGGARLRRAVTRKEKLRVREDSHPTTNGNWDCSHLNQSLMELGALVCTPRQTKCLECPVKKICVAYQENRVEEFPNLEKRIEPTKRRFVAFVIEENQKFLVRQRPAKVVNAHLWEFPNIEINGDKLVLEKQPFNIAPKTAPLCTIKHSITRYRITLDAFRASFRSDGKISNGKWLRISELQKLAFPSAHRQILEKLAE
jgi:A/G-specific adenine glycosylase